MNNGLRKMFNFFIGTHTLLIKITDFLINVKYIFSSYNQDRSKC